MKTMLVAIVAFLSVTIAGFFTLVDKDVRDLALTFPTDKDILFWSDEQRDIAFRAMDKLPLLVKAREIPAGGTVYPLPEGASLALDMDIDKYMETQRAAGLIVIQDGEVRLEEYRRDFSAGDRWTSFSVAKSLTSTLVGAAIQDGYIDGIDDPVSKYLPGLFGSAYDEVSIKQLMTMTSGVRWNEDYSDPESDVAKFNNHIPEDGVDTTISYMSQLSRQSPPGEEWVYKTGETNLIGLLINRATGRTLAEYASEKIWKPFGMESDASWLLSRSGEEISGCCIQVTLRDYARIGLFLLNDGVAAGSRVVPEGWVDEATRNHVGDIGSDYGYGYQWWTLDNGTYMARGIFGQAIFIDPSRKLVIASVGNWPRASDQELSKHRLSFYISVQQAVDQSSAL